MQTFYKHPDEKYPIALEFANNLPPGSTITSGTVYATDQNGVNLTDTVLEDPDCAINGTRAEIVVQEGTHGQRINLKFTIVCDDESTLVENIVMRIDSNI